MKQSVFGSSVIKNDQMGVMKENNFGNSNIRNETPFNSQISYKQPSSVMRFSGYQVKSPNQMNLTSSDFRMSQNAHMNSNHIAKDSKQFISDPIDTDFIKNISRQSFPEKTEQKFATEIEKTITIQIMKSQKLTEEITHLRRVFESEQQKLSQMETQYNEEFKHTKNTETETLKNLQNLENYIQNSSQIFQEEEHKCQEMTQEYQQVQTENDMLRAELKKLGEITSEKILDLENNINSIAKIKELEIESFQMEKEKLTNTAEFVIEQMKVHYNERTFKSDEQMQKLNIEKDKISGDLRAISEELKSFNANADYKINSILNHVIQEETEKNQHEAREWEERARKEEEEVSQINRTNQELINRQQTAEREGRTRLMNKRNENTKLREDFHIFEQNNAKLMLHLMNETKEFDKKKEQIDVLRDDREDYQNKSHLAGEKFHEEISSIQEGHEEHLREMENEYLSGREREAKLIHAIREESERFFEMQRRHADVIEDIQKGFNVAIESQFAKIKK